MKLEICLFLNFLVIVAASAEACTSKSTCRECIQKPGCLWYTAHDNNDKVAPGCYDSSLTHPRQFALEKVYDPDSFMVIVENRDLSDDVLLAPQKLRFKLRPLVPVNFYVSFKTLAADTFPPPRFENVRIMLLTNSTEAYKNHYEILATKCPENSSNLHQSLNLVSEVTGSTLTLEIEFLCGCPCEQSHNTIPNADRCSRRGTYNCGICECHPGTSGRYCECDKPDVDPNACVSRNGTECSGRGACICGNCECEVRSNPSETIFGKYCECDNFSCDRYEGHICGGEDHGSCVCGICECKPGWEGPACQLENAVKNK